MSSCSRFTDRLKNVGCWYLNKMIDDSVHQDHLTMLSASVEIFPAKMFKHAPNTACSSLITCYKSCHSVLHSLSLIDIRLCVRVPDAWCIFKLGAHKCLVTGSFDIRGQDERFRLRNAIVLLAFFVMVSVCWFQDKLLSVVTPRYLALSVRRSIWPWMV